MSSYKFRSIVNKRFYSFLVLTISCFFISNSTNAQSGEELFKTYCNSCHLLSSTESTGPGLAGITEKRSKEWLVSWITNSTELINSGDPDAVQVYEDYNKMMMPPFTQLSEAEVVSIIDYLEVAAPADAGGGEATATTATAAEADEPLLTEGEKTAIKWTILIMAVILFFVFRMIRNTKKRLMELGIAPEAHATRNYVVLFAGILGIMVGLFYLLSIGLQNNTGQLNGIMFAVFPYVAFAIFIIGSIYRYTKNGFKVSSLSTQFLEGKKLFWGSQPFHWGLIILFFGHLIAFLFPSTLIAFNGHPVRLLILEISSFAFGLAALLGLILLIKRRLTTRSLQVVANRMDMMVYTVLMIQIVSGLSVAFFVRWGSTWFASVLTPYLRSIFSFNPDIEAISVAPMWVQIHVVSAFLIIAIIPFSRFMHFLVAPIDYLWRKYQVVIWNWDRKAMRHTSRHNIGKRPRNH
ncbi:MAG: respiratory nitrate reductase subunit gamma [Crocinitomicaceae bacterium]|nr:respiratory nitrate reductase subunit gamma [Crocinitomicaceae bacterium]